MAKWMRKAVEVEGELVGGGVEAVPGVCVCREERAFWSGGYRPHVHGSGDVVVVVKDGDLVVREVDGTGYHAVRAEVVGRLYERVEKAAVKAATGKKGK